MIGDRSRVRPRGAAMRPHGPVIGRAGQRALAFADRILGRMRRTSSEPRRLDRVLLGLGRWSVAMRATGSMRFSPIVRLHLHAASVAADTVSSQATPAANPRRELVQLRKPSPLMPEAAARAAPAAATAAPRPSRTLAAPAAPVQPRPRQPPRPMERVYARAAPTVAQAAANAVATSVTAGWPTAPSLAPRERTYAAASSSTTQDITLSRTEVGRVAEDVMTLLERRFLASRERFGGR